MQSEFVLHAKSICLQHNKRVRLLFSFKNPEKAQKPGKKFLQNSISFRDGPKKYRNKAEMKEHKKTAL